MKLIFAILILFTTSATGAIRTISNTGGNYSSTGTWVEGIVPTSNDTVVATATSERLIVNTSSVAKMVDFTNYVDTLYMNSTLTIGGNFKLITGMTVTGTGTLSIIASATLTSSSITWTGAITAGAASTYTITFADDWTIVGAFGLNANGAKILNGGNIYAQGNIAIASVSSGGGTSVFYVTGSANQSISGTFTNSITINKSSGTLTIGSTTIANANFTYTTSGTVTVTAATTLGIIGTVNINSTSAITWQNVTIGANSPTTTSVTFSSTFNMAGTWSSHSLGTFNLTNCSNIGTIPTMNMPASTGAITYNLDAPITVSGTLTVTGTNGASLNTSTLYLQGNLALSGAAGISGTGTLEMNGTSKTITSTAGANLSCNFTINSSTITLNSGSTLRYGTRTFKLNNNLLGTGVVAIVGSSTIDGGSNSVNYFWVITAGVTVTFSSGLIVNTQFQSLAGTSASRVSFVSSSAGVQRKFTLLNNGTATQSVIYTNATDIDSGDGQTIWSFGSPTLSNTINWNELKSAQSRGYTF